MKSVFLTPTIFSSIFCGDIKYFLTKSTWFISFFTQIMARASDPGGLPLQNNRGFCAFNICQNPGGDLEIWDFYVRGVWTLNVSVNYVSISYSANFGNKIIWKFRIFIFLTEISKSKYLTLPPILKGHPPIPGRGWGGISKIHFRVVLGHDDQLESCEEF